MRGITRGRTNPHRHVWLELRTLARAVLPPGLACKPLVFDKYRGKYRPSRLKSWADWIDEVAQDHAVFAYFNIEWVLPGSPADNAGLMAGDDVIRVDKTRVEALADLQMAIAKYRPGETIQLVIQRDGSRKKIDVTLGAYSFLEIEF